MFGELVDVVLFSPNSAQYLEELPAAYAQEQFGLRPRVLASDLLPMAQSRHELTA